MTEEEREYLASNKAQRMMEIRGAIFEALPDEGDSEEITIAGLSLFLQAALHMADQDVEKVHGLLEHVIELAQKMNEAEDDEDSNPSDKTVH
ncbi:MAG: hypothetical protein ACPHZ7_03130 [Vibrio toranzoniae]